MQHLLLVLSIIMLAVIAGDSRLKETRGKKSMVTKMQKTRAKKANADFSADRISVYSSRFDMIVN